MKPKKGFCNCAEVECASKKIPSGKNLPDEFDSECICCMLHEVLVETKEVNDKMPVPKR